MMRLELRHEIEEDLFAPTELQFTTDKQYFDRFHGSIIGQSTPWMILRLETLGDAIGELFFDRFLDAF